MWWLCSQLCLVLDANLNTFYRGCRSGVASLSVDLFWQLVGRPTTFSAMAMLSLSSRITPGGSRIECSSHFSQHIQVTSCSSQVTSHHLQQWKPANIISDHLIWTVGWTGLATCSWNSDEEVSTSPYVFFKVKIELNKFIHIGTFKPNPSSSFTVKE